MLVRQMLTESEAYIIAFMTTLKILENEQYEKTSQELHVVISTYIKNDIIEKYVERLL